MNCTISREVVPTYVLMLVCSISAGRNDLEHQATMLRSQSYSLDRIYRYLHL